MKKTIGILSLILLISCAPDQQLVEENEKLKIEAQQQRSIAEEQKLIAEKCMEEANLMRQKAEEAAAEAIRQAGLAEEQRRAAQNALEKLKKCQ